MSSLEPVLEKVGRILTDLYGIRVVCQGQRCCTDGHTIYLPALPDDIPKDLWDTIRGFVDHEASHLIFKSNFAIGAEFKRQHGDEAFGLLNLLEDLRVEEAMRQRLPGSAANLAHAYRAAEHSAEECAASGMPVSLMRQLAFAVTAHVQGRPPPSFITPDGKALADLIASEAEAAVHAPNTKVVAQLASSALAKIKAAQPHVISRSSNVAETVASRKTKEKTRGRQPGKSLTPSATTGTGSSSTAESTSPSSTTDSTPSKESTTSSSSCNGAVEGSTVIGSVGNFAGTGIIGDMASALAKTVNRLADASDSYRVWSTDADKVTVVESPWTQATDRHMERMRPLMRYVAGVRQRLLQSLMAETRARWRPDVDTGTLNPRALHRLAAAHNRADVPAARAALSRRVFRERVIARRVETAVTLLIDVSHSMNGRKLDLARTTALVMGEALDRLHIPTMIVAFSTAQGGVPLREAAKQTGIPASELENKYRFAPLVHEIFKAFDEPFRHASARFDALRTHMLTPLGESMLFAARALAKRPESRRVLMVLTDGRPTVGLGNDVSTLNHAHESIRRIERARIDVVLIGMVERCVLDLHPRSVVVDAIDDLPRVVMSQLETALSRRPH